MPTIPCYIYPATQAQYPPAAALAHQFQLHLMETAPTTADFCLCLTPTHLELQDLSQATKPLYVDFVAGQLAYRRLQGGGRKQAIARAVGLKKSKNPRVLDVTAGLGRDGFVLAGLGCQVHWLERAPMAAALLYDGWQRACQDATIGEWVTARLRLTFTEAKLYLAQSYLSPAPEVIYLDPMYPHRHQSALVKKEMRIFRTLVGADTDAVELLNLALTQARCRVVVKRPRTAQPLGQQVPSLTIESKNTRFDVYLVG